MILFGIVINPTIVAATVAASAALLNLFFNIFIQAKSESRAAHRKSLEPNYNKLGELLHQSIAIADVVAKRIKRGQGIKEWVKENTKTKKGLEECRKQVRYSLWGLDEGLKILTRTTNWVTLCKNIPERMSVTVQAADKLRETIDAAIIESYLSGKMPSQSRISDVNSKVSALKDVYENNRIISRQYRERLARSSNIT